MCCSPSPKIVIRCMQHITTSDKFQNLFHILIPQSTIIFTLSRTLERSTNLIVKLAKTHYSVSVLVSNRTPPWPSGLRRGFGTEGPMIDPKLRRCGPGGVPFSTFPSLVLVCLPRDNE